jgi:hypothetical protein
MILAGSMPGVSGSCDGILEFLNLGYSLTLLSKQKLLRMPRLISSSIFLDELYAGYYANVSQMFLLVLSKFMCFISTILCQFHLKCDFKFESFCQK